MNSITRRQFVIGGAAFITAAHLRAATPQCTLMPEQEEGPYYIDGALLRGDIREEKAGVPLKLRIALVDAKRCAPLEKAALDIWHCDATGVYSGFTSSGGGPPGGRGRGGPPRARVTDETRFLRGVQLTDKQGIAEFQTLYPGWYAGRTIHIHLKVRVGGSAVGQRYSDGHVSHTGQVFLPEELTEQIAKLNPYSSHSGVHRTLQSEDQIFRSQSGAQSIMRVEKMAKATNTEGYVATFTVAVDPEATPARR